ncbi:MAG: acyltransferase [Thermaerobacter sp.]
MSRRRVRRHPVPPGRNSMHYWPQAGGFWKVVRNFIVITAARYVPWLGVKNAMYRMLGMRVGRDVAFGLMAMPDVFFPELISIGDNSLVGYNTTILTHEFLTREWRTGPVEIGRNVMIGANCTILPGVRIGDGAVVGAHSLVNRDIPPGVVAAGVPARVLGEAAGDQDAGEEVAAAGAPRTGGPAAHTLEREEGP